MNTLPSRACAFPRRAAALRGLLALLGFPVLFGLTVCSTHAQLSQKQLDALMAQHAAPPPRALAVTPTDKGLPAPSAPEDQGDNLGTRAAVQNGAASLTDQMAGFGFGAGIAALYLNGARPVESATVDSTNTVRIATKSKVRAGAIFETHWLFEELPFTRPASDQELAPNQNTLAKTILALRDENDHAPQANAVRRHVSAGPMFTAEIGDNVIRSVGIGALVAMQHYRVSTTGDVTPHGVAFNLGLVVFIEPSVKRVHGSYTDGQVVPAGTTLTLEEEHRFGYGVVFSTRF